MAKKSRKEVQRTCQECGNKFKGHPLARYCPECRQAIVRDKEALQAARPAKGVRGPVAVAQQNQGGISDFIKKNLTFTRLAIANVVVLALIHGIAMFISKSDSVSLEMIAKAEDFQSSSFATALILVWGCALRGFYWWRETKGHVEWKDNYWKQLLTWFVCLVFTVGFSTFLLLRPV
jgi:hypothetical protein